MLVSIIIPVYNVEKYLGECLDSVLAQDYRDLEIILVDDGSTDSSGAICDDYATRDSRITVYHTENGGLSCARNYGTARASGEFIQYLDSDDCLTEGAISSSMAKISDGVDAVISHFVEWNPELGLNKTEDFEFKDEYVQNLSGEDAFASLMDNSMRPIWQAWRPLFRRSLITENRFQFTPNLLSEDLDLMPHIYRQCRAIAVNDRENIMYRVARDGSIMTTPSIKRFTDIFSIIGRWDEFIAQGTGSDRFREAMSRQIAQLYLFYIKSIRNLASEDKPAAITAAQPLAHLLRSKHMPIKFRFAYRLLGFRGVLRLMHSN